MDFPSFFTYKDEKKDKWLQIDKKVLLPLDKRVKM